MDKMDKVMELVKEMRIRTNGYQCPMCGAKWSPDYQTRIHATVIKGFFGTQHPAWKCLECGYTWKSK